MKLYADEAGATLVRNLAVPIVSALARVEVPAALWRKHRAGELRHADAALLVDTFEDDLFGGAFAIVGVTTAILDAAAADAARHELCAFDAVQLATATAARSADPDLDGFACFDRALMAAARAEGFRPLD